MEGKNRAMWKVWLFWLMRFTLPRVMTGASGSYCAAMHDISQRTGKLWH